MSQSWETLVAVALLGTDRQSALPSLGEDGVASLLAQVDATDTEGWVLSAAGTLTAYQRAGQKSLEREGSLFERSEMENSSPCSDACIPFIKTILDSDHQSALPEFLSLLQQSGQSIPPEFLPKFLDWGYSHSEVRSQLRSVIGDRGHWLAGLNPKWAYAQATPQSQNPEDWQALWESSDLTVRLNLLREWRSQNPEAARECLATTWKQESAKDRTAFLECLAVGLSLADEAFLEGGLGDRGKEVRAVAVDLLSRLPESQFSQQIAIQISEYIKFKTIEGKLQVEVTLPQTDDSRWKTYALHDRTHWQFIKTKHGDRASLLIQLIGLSPLSVWEVTGLPEKLIDAITDHDWEIAFIQGWSLASQRQQNLDWTNSLLQWFGQKSSFRLQRIDAADLVQKLLSLSQEETRVQWIANWLEPQCWSNEVLDLLVKTLLAPWSLEFSQMLLNSAQHCLEVSKTNKDKKYSQVQWWVAHHLKQMAYSLHPDLLMTEQATNMTLFDRENQTNIFEDVCKILNFRQHMRQTIVVKIDPSG